MHSLRQTERPFTNGLWGVMLKALIGWTLLKYERAGH
jgi:hypothetical protein